MAILLTYALLLLTIATAITLRRVWPRLPSRAKLGCKSTAALLLVPSLFSVVSKWDATSHPVQSAEAWVRIVACQFAIVFLTLLAPRWLTVATAVVLLPLSFATSVAGPLSDIFRPTHYTTRSITGGYYLETAPWVSDSGTNSGVDFDLFYKHSSGALLRRDIIGQRLYTTQCNPVAVSATLVPQAHLINLHCPPIAPGLPDAAESGTDLHFYIPRAAQSPELLAYPQHGPGPNRLERWMLKMIRSNR